MLEQMENSSQILFQLQGLNDSLTNRRVFFALALTSYVFTVVVNLTLVLTVCLDTTLHQPIYVFMCNLCLNGICGASSFYPKLLHDLLADRHVITYAGCMTQMFFAYSYVFCEFTSLTVMAYDRYVAICRPLQYQALMTVQKAAQLLALTWSFSLTETVVGILLVVRLPLCGRRLPKVFCTSWEVVKLSCSDTAANNAYGFLLMLLHVLQAGLILVSYGGLIRTAARSQADRRKFVQTCVPHLAALLVFTASLLFDTLNSRYGSGSMEALQNLLAAEFLVVPPLVNPVIYGVNLRQVRTRIRLRFLLTARLTGNWPVPGLSWFRLMIRRK